MSKSRLFAAAALVATGALGVGAAQAQEPQVSWSVTIGSPVYTLPVPTFVRPAPVFGNPPRAMTTVTSNRPAGTAMATASRTATTASTTRRDATATAFRTNVTTSTIDATTATAMVFRTATTGIDPAPGKTFAGRFALQDMVMPFASAKFVTIARGKSPDPAVLAQTRPDKNGAWDA
jgi:hypothetical protein